MKEQGISKEMESFRRKTAEALNEKNAVSSCPRCGHNEFTLGRGIAYISVDESPTGDRILIGGPTIPSMMIICEHCGYISFHAIGALGLMDDFKQLSVEPNESDKDK